MTITAKCKKSVNIFGMEFVPEKEYTFDQTINYEKDSFGEAFCLRRRSEVYSIKIPPCFIYSFYDRKTCEDEGWCSIDLMGNIEPMLCFEDYFYVV